MNVFATFSKAVKDKERADEGCLREERGEDGLDRDVLAYHSRRHDGRFVPVCFSFLKLEGNRMEKFICSLDDLPRMRVQAGIHICDTIP